MKEVSRGSVWTGTRGAQGPPQPLPQLRRLASWAGELGRGPALLAGIVVFMPAFVLCPTRSRQFLVKISSIMEHLLMAELCSNVEEVFVF